MTLLILLLMLAIENNTSFPGWWIAGLAIAAVVDSGRRAGQ